MDTSEFAPVEAQYVRAGDIIVPRGRHHLPYVVIRVQRVGTQIRFECAMLGDARRFSSDYATEIQTFITD